MVQCFLQLTELSCDLEDFLFSLGSLLLELLQLRFGLHERAVQALLIEAEAGEQITTPVEGFGLSEGAIDGGVRG